MTSGCGVGDLRFLACTEEQCTEVKGHSCLVADVAVSCDFGCGSRGLVAACMGKMQGTGRGCIGAGPGAGQLLKLGAGLEGVVLRLGCSSGAERVEAMEQELTRNRGLAGGTAAGGLHGREVWPQSHR